MTYYVKNKMQNEEKEWCDQQNRFLKYEGIEKVVMGMELLLYSLISSL